MSYCYQNLSCLGPPQCWIRGSLAPPSQHPARLSPTHIWGTRTDFNSQKTLSGKSSRSVEVRTQSLLQTVYLNGEDALGVAIVRYRVQAGDLRIVAAERFQHLGEDAGLLAEDPEVVFVWPQRNQLDLTLQRCMVMAQ